MKLRTAKLTRFLAPFFGAALVIVAGSYIWAMNGVLVNQVKFSGETSELSSQDKAKIRTLILNDAAFDSPPKHKLARFTIDMVEKRASTDASKSDLYIGEIYPNTQLYGEGRLIVAQENNEWKITFLGLAD